MKIVITAGGTSERIDNVRKITNSSTGKLGMVIANTILEKYGQKVDKIYYICAKDSYRPKDDKAEIIEIEGTLELEKVVKKILIENEINFFIHSMAVSDYMVDYISTASLLAKEISESDSDNLIDIIKNNRNVIGGTKISSYEDNLFIMLKPTPKIISLIKILSPKTFLVGFKLLDDVSEKELADTATKLLEKNNCDLVVGNDLKNIRSGNHKAIIINKNGSKLIAQGKDSIAQNLVLLMMGDVKE